MRLRMVRPTHIVVHHSLTKDDETVSWGAILNYHVMHRGWDDIGYHAGVENVGGVYYAMHGRDIRFEAAACPQGGLNRFGLHICFVGNYDDVEPPEEMLRVSVRRIIEPWMSEFSIPKERIIGHRDGGLMDGFDWERGQFKTCPGRLFDLAHLRSLV